ncbi:MAG TPA: trypsin-like peptidase domain-containing protein [Solirubrobacteraceae bacterium]|nr:trypsin-like peptidase domain-containing protein [Solirubrobacteraceae bacterium]
MKSARRLIPVIAGAIAGGAIALIVASGGTTRNTTTVIQQARGASTVPASLKTGVGMTVNQIYREDSPGVVDILVASKSASGSLFGGSQESEGEGAGVVLNKQGDIITDEHVIANATSVEVTFQDGQRVSAKVLGSDASTDVGVIRVNVPASDLHPIPFANSDEAQVGDQVVAIGSPFSLPETVTAGIVSQTGRSITAPNNYTISDAIQTDAAINPGNSGGPLLDAAGQVLGLDDQIETNNTTSTGEGSSSGIGFATPGNEDLKVANAIIAGKPVKHAYLGVQLNGTSVGGAQIATSADGGSPIESGSPAAKAGLQPGDLITAVNGKSVTSTDAFIATLGNYSPGNVVTLTVKRGGKTMQVKVTLGVRPQEAPGQGDQSP